MCMPSVTREVTRLTASSLTSDDDQVGRKLLVLTSTSTFELVFR